MNRLVNTIGLVATLAVAALAVDSTLAAEIRLRSQAAPRGTILTLGDVADVVSADEGERSRLASTELGPVGSQQRVYRVREIQDLLQSRGVNLVECRFTGSSQIAVDSAFDVKSNQDAPLSQQAYKRAQRRLRDSIVERIRAQSGDVGPWDARFELTPELIRAAVNPSKSLSVEGGQKPWIGHQAFTVLVVDNAGTQRFPMAADVYGPAMVVAVSHSVAKGEVIRESDLISVRSDPSTVENGSVRDASEIVGKQAVKCIPDGKVVLQDDVQSQIMVRRGDVVTAFARSGGIVARTMVRARNDGSTGDLISVEGLKDKTAFQARVSGPREVEVFAKSASAERQANLR